MSCSSLFLILCSYTTRSRPTIRLKLSPLQNFLHDHKIGEKSAKYTQGIEIQVNQSPVDTVTALECMHKA